MKRLFILNIILIFLTSEIFASGFFNHGAFWNSQNIPVSCPTGFVLVPGNEFYGTRDFCVMQFEAKQNLGIAESVATGTPWHTITPPEAFNACASMSQSGHSGQFALISNPEWMTIASNIESNPANWSSGIVSTGGINNGHSDLTPGNALAVTDINDLYDSTGNNSGEALGSGWEQKRTHTLSNGSSIWDFSGNIHEWVDWSFNDDVFTQSYTNGPGGWVETNSLTGSFQASDVSAKLGSTSANYAGQWYGGAGGSSIRGGRWNDGTTKVGIYSLRSDFINSTAVNYIGFRCVYRPNTNICPQGFINVPGNTTLGTKDFCVMKYETKGTLNKIISKAAETPHATISANDSFSQCSSMNQAGYAGEYSLISNPEWITIARNIENVSSNWSGGSVGSGRIPSGHNDSTPGNVISTTDFNDPYNGTGNNSGQAPGSGWEQKRTHNLSNGSTIWDLSGNVWEWTDWNATDSIFTTGPINGPSAYTEITSISGSFTSLDLQSAGGYSSAQSFGRWKGDGTGGAAARSMSYNYGTNAGIFAVTLGNAPTVTHFSIGYRCVYRPNAITCPSGYVQVKGNPALGTEDFCVMQFEAKDDGSGNAVSQPTSNPWVSLEAKEATDACEAHNTNSTTGYYSLISNQEWMTIARDAENVASNWSGGSVGSGHIPRGHSDNVPPNAIAITDVNDPYDGTGNNATQSAGSGWEQKRTHRLSNGSIVWDLGGNVLEYVDWSIFIPGFTLAPTNSTSVWRENTVLNGSIVADDIQSPGGYTSANSIGSWFGGVGGAAQRGGYWTSGTYTGLYHLTLNNLPAVESITRGFRCVWRPTKCPGGYVKVSNNPTYGTGDFCVMKFEAKDDGSSNVVSKPGGSPWVSTNQDSAYEKCEDQSEPSLGGYFSMISNPEWMTIARDIEKVRSNWSGYNVGSGHLPRGHSDSSPNNSLTVADLTDAYSGTGNTSANAPGSGWEQRRKLSLSNGTEIWDFAGNVYEYVDWEPNNVGYQSFPSGCTDGGGSPGYNDMNEDIANCSVTRDDIFPETSTAYNDSSNSIGRWFVNSVNTSSYRSGAWPNGTISGVFHSYMNDNSATGIYNGYRCVWREHSMNCPDGYIGVKGNSIIGTQDFCVMQMEARNDGGAPASLDADASTSPWTSITAVTAQSNCEALTATVPGSFSLISNNEWMTIARDIEKTRTNWSSGVVGTGYVPRGHSDSSPGSVISIADQTDYYTGTGNTSSQAAGSGWEQKRVHQLSNGNKIWDLGGNAGEWVDYDASVAGFTSGPTSCGAGWVEFSSSCGSLTDKQYKPKGSFTSSNGMGQWYGGAGGALIRGHAYNGGIKSGPFGFTLYNPSSAFADTGYRCVFRPDTSITIGSGARKWSNGSYAKNCNAYKNPTSGYSYTGSTGDGLYWIDPDGDGTAFQAECDMTFDSGGWTLVGRYYVDGSHANMAVAGSVGTLTSTSQTTPAKLADTVWNDIRDATNNETSDSKMRVLRDDGEDVFLDVSIATDLNNNYASLTPVYQFSDDVNGTYFAATNGCSPNMVNWTIYKPSAPSIFVCYHGNAPAADSSGLYYMGVNQNATIWIR